MGRKVKHSLFESHAPEVAARDSETKSDTIRTGGEARGRDLSLPAIGIGSEIVQIPEREIWSKIPRHLLGRGIGKREQRKILG
jgi:hypothetical protein